MKLLILSTIPVPYRTTVLCGLKKYYEADIFFERCYDQNRSADYFVKDDQFVLLDTEENKALYQKCLRNIKSYDLVLAYDYTSKMGMQLMQLCIRNGVPYALNADGAFVNKNLLKDMIKRYFVRHASLFFAGGPSARDYFCHYGAKEEDIVFHNFTSLTASDIRDCMPDSVKKQEIRDQYRLPQGYLVLSIGQFIHRKGFDILLQAWKDMPETSHLLLIGGGEKKQEYLDYIQKNECKNVQILDFLPKEVLADYYLASDLFVLPTREDVWGLVVNEAMANGLPVITSDMCIAGRELIRNGENGFVVKTEDVCALKEKMLELVENPSLGRTMGATNLNLMQSNTLDEIIESHHKTIEMWREKQQ